MKNLEVLTDFLIENGISFQENYEISDIRVDIYIEKFKVAVDLHLLKDISFGKENRELENRNLLLNRMKTCVEKDIKLYQIYESEWQDLRRKDIWKSMISSKLEVNRRIFARKCSVRELNVNESSTFLNDNHMQGTVPSTIKLGLIYEDELVACFTAGYSRFNKNYDWEILRYCNKKFTNVVGGFSKLLKYFTRNYGGSMISYANKRWSDGSLYEKVGFNLLEDASPNYYYFVPGTFVLKSRNQYQKHKLHKKLEIFDPDKTEVDNCFNNGLYRVWDVGNKVYYIKGSPKIITKPVTIDDFI